MAGKVIIQHFIIGITGHRPSTGSGHDSGRNMGVPSPKVDKFMPVGVTLQNEALGIPAHPLLETGMGNRLHGTRVPINS